MLKLHRALVLGLILTQWGCSDGGSSSSSSTTTTTTSSSSSASIDAFPSGLSISSPLADQSTASVSSAGKFTRSIDEVESGHGPRAATLTTSSSLADKESTLNAIATATNATTCQVTLSELAARFTDPTCYGPALNYQGHLDATTTDQESGQLPTGDLGIWSANASSTDTTACAAEKFNTEISKIASKLDNALLLGAASMCVINTDSSLSLPATISASTDLQSALSTALAVNNSSVTLSTATITYEKDEGSFPLYNLQFVFASGSSTVTINMRHVKTNTAGTEYKGEIYGKTVGGTADSAIGDSSAYSIRYERGATNIKYHMLSMGYNDSAVSNPFTTTGQVDVTTSWSGSFAQTIMDINASTKLGNVSYAWQAGKNDDSSRVFNLYTLASGSNITGHAFFGYGSAFGSSLTDNSITKFVCNWAGPNNSHTGLTGKAQKQSMSLSGGTFVASSSSINYAPVNSCDMTAGQTRSGGSTPFRYSTTTIDTTATQPAVSNELVTLATDTDYASYTAPTAPADF